jgi:hypothetical protein
MAWLGNDDMNSANLCPSCRAICFPELKHQKETGLILDVSFLYSSMHSNRIAPPWDCARLASYIMSDDDMAQLDIRDDEEE